MSSPVALVHIILPLAIVHSETGITLRHFSANTNSIINFSLCFYFRCFPCDNLGLGIGDKLMLRLVALKIGLEKVAVLPKRALQFGSRIANKNEKGCDISKNFLSK